MLLRLIIIVVLCYLVIAALKAIFKSGTNKLSARQKSTTESEEMVFDPQCRSYVPKADAVAKSGQYFCSQECARIYLSR